VCVVRSVVGGTDGVVGRLVDGDTIKGYGRLCLTLEGSFTSRMVGATCSEREGFRVLKIHFSEKSLVVPVKWYLVVL
jgi:hypothetical protein